MQLCSQGFLPLSLMSNSKKTLEMSLDITSSFKTFVDTRVQGFVLNVDCLENLRRKFIQKRYLLHTHVLFSGL